MSSEGGLGLMSPVTRQQTHTVRALVVAAAGVVLALGGAAAIAFLVGRGTVEWQPGDDTFNAGEAQRVAAVIATDGPIPYPDPVGGERDIVLQHLGEDAEDGWMAFDARPRGAPRQCTIQWQADQELFHLLDENGEVTDDCDGREFPADGGALPQYPVSIDDGNVMITVRGD